MNRFEITTKDGGRFVIETPVEGVGRLDGQATWRYYEEEHTTAVPTAVLRALVAAAIVAPGTQIRTLKPRPAALGAAA